MTLVGDMAAVAVECVKKPGRRSVWSEELGRYVCNDEPEYQRAVAARSAETPGVPPIDPAFKLVFLTAAGGTLLFIVICVTVTILAGQDMPDPMSKLVTGLLDMAKIGFGSIAGLLGGQALKARAMSVTPVPRPRANA